MRDSAKTFAGSYLLLAAGLLCVALTSTSSQAQTDTELERCVRDLSSYSFPVGVNRTNLALVSKPTEVLKEITKHNIRDIRLTMNPPFERSAEIAAFASALGLRVLLNIPLGYSEFFATSAYVREGGGRFFPQRRLSEIDVKKFRRSFDLFLRRLDEQNGHLEAAEIGNEINWTDFNGDLPLDDPGIVIGIDNYESWEGRARVELGFQRYAELLREARQALLGSRQNGAVPLLSAGIVTPGSSGRTRSGGTALTAELVKHLYQKYYIPQLVDGFAFHSYPGVSDDPEVQLKLTTSNLRRGLLKFCDGSLGQKGCWITEWGFKFVDDDCQTGDGMRALRMEQFLRVASCSKTLISAVYLYDWDQSPTYSIYRCGKLLDGGMIFRDSAQ